MMTHLFDRRAQEVFGDLGVVEEARLQPAPPFLSPGFVSKNIPA